ncbi:MAG: hypothetical protein HY814_13125 [Candidatus Riflebacteria bacterium]|nr:hypothetical protein [Candidatus Riflebacteria bacterium]
MSRCKSRSRCRAIRQEQLLAAIRLTLEALVSSNSGEPERAEEALLRAIALQRAALGSNCLQLGSLLHLLAQVQGAQASDEAVRLLETTARASAANELSKVASSDSEQEDDELQPSLQSLPARSSLN